MGWAVTGCARKRCLATGALGLTGNGWAWRRLAARGSGMASVGALRGVGIVQQKATTIELVRTRGI
jgi:hypothetical protein